MQIFSLAGAVFFMRSFWGVARTSRVKILAPNAYCLLADRSVSFLNRGKAFDKIFPARRSLGSYAERKQVGIQHECIACRAVPGYKWIMKISS